MSKVDFVELANYYQEEYKKLVDSRNDCSMLSTLYFSISENNEVKYSVHPSILIDAYKCILINRCRRKAETYWYDYYFFQIIDEFGCVHDDGFRDVIFLNRKLYLDNGFELHIDQQKYGFQGSLWLAKDGYCIYECTPPYEREMAKLWEVYVNASKCKTAEEAKLMGELAKKDNEIFKLMKENENLTYAKKFLERERNMYVDLLDEIKELVSKNK